MDNNPGLQAQEIKDDEEILFDRNAIRTMAKDIRSLQEANTSERKEDFLVNEEKEVGLKKIEFAPIENEENKSIVKEKEKIQNLLVTLDKIEENSEEEKASEGAAE